jgi:methionine-rich copper-binding protein CopC
MGPLRRRPDARPGCALNTIPANSAIKGNTMSKKTTMAAIMITAGLFNGAANAHPELQSAEPAAGAAMTTSPTQIRITFNENVIPKFSGVELKDQTGKMIATGKAATDPTDKKQLVVPVQEPLPPGDYKVEWHAVSDDTHRVTGSYSFSVAR